MTRSDLHTLTRVTNHCTVMPMQVEDAVEASLVKEVDCIRDYQHKMKLLVEVMVKQVDSNCQAQKLLVTDIRNKVGGGI